MKNLVPDSIKYSSMSSFTYPSYPTKVNGITHLKSYPLLIGVMLIGVMPKAWLKVISRRKNEAKNFRGSGFTFHQEKAEAPVPEKKWM